MNNISNNISAASLVDETNRLLLEISNLKKQLNYERNQHKHWEELAMIFHDALWSELKSTRDSNREYIKVEVIKLWPLFLPLSIACRLL